MTAVCLNPACLNPVCLNPVCLNLLGPGTCHRSDEEEVMAGRGPLKLATMLELVGH